MTKEFLFRNTRPSGEVYRDKNTLVEVTIHRKPKQVTKIPQTHHHHPGGSWSESLSDSENVVFRKPTISSKQKSSDGFKRSKSKDKNKENMKHCEKTDLTDLENTIQTLKLDLERSRHEAARYRVEYNVMVKQVEISKQSVTGLEKENSQLKQIISKLTKNNTDLLDIVAEQIRYEEKIEDLEEKNKQLSDQLQSERTESVMLRKNYKSAQTELKQMRSASADVLGEYIQSKSRSSQGRVPSLKLGDETKDVLGINDDDGDSAIYDPRTESLRTRSCQDPPTAAFQKLNLELSESEDVDQNWRHVIQPQVFDISLQMKEIQIPKQRPFPGESHQLSVSSAEDQTGLNNSSLSTLSEAKFLKGLEQSIEVDQTNVTSQSEQE